ncbi:MAG: phosphate acyltransferase PlsX, partial [Myxococcaceae bacterium]
MSRTVSIAFDVMGSDFGPEEVVRGAAALTREAPHLHAVLVGDREIIETALAQTVHSGEQISVHHAGQIVAMTDKPGEALAHKPDSSIVIAAQLVA